MTAPAPVAFDARPLTDPVDRAAAKAFVRELRAQGKAPGWMAGSGGAVIAVAVVLGIIVLGMSGTVFTALLAVLASGGGFVSLFTFAPFLIIGGAIAVVIVALVRGGGGGERWYRLDRFARTNGMSFLPTVAKPPLPGLIFQRGSSRASSDIVRGMQPRFVEFANYRYTTGSGKNRTTHRWGYVAVKLDVPLPHIVLDAVGNNGLFGVSNLPAAFDRDQRLSLEGDFDRFFSLYCPPDYERDALYLFTPDIMARFIDNAAALDVEIVDDWLFLYAKRDLSTLDPATWAWLFSVVAALLDKFAQWARWRDDRLASGPSVDTAAVAAGAAPSSAPMITPPPAGVAPGGQRLKTRTSVVTVIVVIVMVVVWSMPTILGLFH